MGRLIDADALKNMRFSEGLREDGILYVPFGEVIRNINDAPTAYDIENVVEELEEKTTLAYNRYMDCPSYNPTLALHSPVFERYKTQYQERKMCLEIVRRGGVE